MNDEHIAHIIKAGNEYINRGFSVIPVRGKIPLIPWEEFQNRLLTKEEFEKTVEINKLKITGLAIVTGKISGITVVDVDSEEAEAKLKLPLGPSVKTGRGFHHYFKYSDKLGTTTKLIEGVDVRSDGGYVIAPPSVHESGKKYEWLTNLENEMPELSLEWFGREAKKVEPTKWSEVFQGVGEGERNSTMSMIAGKLMVYLPERDWENVVLPLMYAVNQNNHPPLPHKEVRSVFNSIAGIESKQRSNDQKEVELRIVSLKELLTSVQVERKFMIQDLLPQGLNVISGQPGAGKSWVMLEMSKAIASGKTFLDKFEVVQGSVLIVDGESSEQELKRRMRMMKFEENLPIFIMSQQGLKLDNSKSLDFLLRKCRELGIKFLIFDPFSAMHSSTENSADEMQKVMEAMEKFTKEQITVLFLHHLRKDSGDKPNNASQALRGSSVILSRVDSQSNIKTENYDVFEIQYSQEKLRNQKKIKPFKVVIQEDEWKNISIKYIGEAKAKVPKSILATNKIIEELESGEKHRKHLINALEEEHIFKGRTASDVIRKLVEQKKVIESTTAKGKVYKLPSSQEEEPQANILPI